MGRACGTNWGEEELILLIRKPEGKRPLGIPRPRWIDTIKLTVL
jgi:hypothetical protein